MFGIWFLSEFLLKECQTRTLNAFDAFCFLCLNASLFLKKLVRICCPAKWWCPPGVV